MTRRPSDSYTKKHFNRDPSDPLWNATKLSLESDIEIILHELNEIKDMQKSTKSKDIKSQWEWRRRLAKLFAKYDTRITRASEILRYCTKESVVENKKNVINYLLTCFESWMTADVAAATFHRFLSPYKIMNRDISFTSVHEEIRGGRGSKDVDIVNHVDIHIFDETTKDDLINYIEDNWEVIRYAFYSDKLSTRLKEESLRNMVIRYLLSNSDMKNLEICDALEKPFAMSRDQDGIIRTQKSLMLQELASDWFNVASRSYEDDFRKNPKIYLRSIDFTEQGLEKVISGEPCCRLERFILRFDRGKKTFFLDINSSPAAV